MKRDGERGSALVIALTMILVVGLMASAALTYANTSLRATNGSINPDRNATHAADGAVDLAVKYLEANAGAGVAGGSTCGDANSFNSVVTLPAAGSAPAVDVRCRPAADSGTVVGGSGGVNDTTPAYSILALGTRNGEPGPHNQSPLDANTVYSNMWAERGIDLQRSSTGGNSPVAFGSSIYSNGAVRRGASSGALTTTGSISARGACENVSPCTVVPYTTAAKADPGYPSRTPNLTPRNVPACPAGTLVTFQPGWYSSATAMNNLFRTCKDKDFWFQPGTYYFDFRDTSGGTQCRPASAVAADALHEWCIGPFADSKARVVGGATPPGWSQPANVQTTLSTFAAGASAPQSWSQQSNMVSINNQWSSYSWTFDTSDTFAGAIYPTPGIPTDAQAVVSVEADVVSQVTSGGAGRSLVVLYGDASNLENLTLCAAYPINGNSVTLTGLQSCLDTPEKVNSAVLALAADPSGWFGQVRLDGMRMRVTYTPAGGRLPFPDGCDPSQTGVQWIFGGDSRVYVSDGTLELCAGPNPGGSSTNQQIALYGVPPTPPLRPSAATAGALASIGEQGGIASNDITFTPQCGNDPGEIGCFIGWGSGTTYGSVQVDFPPGQFALPANTVLQRLGLRASYNTFPTSTSPEFVVHQYQNPAGWSCTADSGLPASTADQFSAFMRSVPTSCLTAARLASGFTVEWRARKQVSCVWGDCGGPVTQKLDGLELLVQLDPTAAGTAVVMPQDGCIAPMPNDYVSGQPLTNRYGVNAWAGNAAPDCAVLKWDAVARTSGTASQIGCYSGQVSLQGTLYAPGAAVDMDQAGPKTANCNASAPSFTAWSYPIFNRGAVMRTLRVKGYRDPTPHTAATCGSGSCGGVAQDRVVTLQARIAGSTKVEARIRYPVSGGPPEIEHWTVA